MWTIGKIQLNSRLLLGTAQYPSPKIMCEAINVSKTEVITVSLRRQLSTQKKKLFLGVATIAELLSITQYGRMLFRARSSNDSTSSQRTI